MGIYSDQLDNNWTSTGNATTNLANMSPVWAGTHSIAVTAGAGQAFTVSHSALGAGYSALDFFINGGATGGQNVVIKATLNGTPQAAVRVSALPANRWVHVVADLSLLGVANQAGITGFSIVNATGSAEPTFYVDSIVLKTPSTALQSVYSDQLDSGWQNWSWATVNLSNASPAHTGGHSIAVTAQAWQALYLENGAPAQTPLGIQFWINGGASGGQKLNVNATLNGNGQTAVALSPLAKNAWTFVKIPLSSFGITDPTRFDGFWIQDATGTTQPTFYVDDIAEYYQPYMPPSSISCSIDASVHSPISPFIYGTNAPDWAGASKYLTLGRSGGNRWTAYNWENNASNAGTDWYNQNDNYLGGGTVAGEAIRAPAAAALAAGKSYIVTVPIEGYVAADINPPGDVNQTPNYLQTRFRVSLPSKGSAFVYPPNLNDAYVYQDEFVSWMEGKFPRTDPSKQIFYMLDNEPDLWSSTHPRIHPNAVTYAELWSKTVSFASAIKKRAPGALVFGPASYGWNGYVNLQNASDANGRDFLNFHLQSINDYKTQNGVRLVDVLDLHWYPEATGDGVRITGEETTPGVVQARIQAPRSLWDPKYVENSWITQSIGGAIDLIPLVKGKIAAHAPGTGLSFSEYYYGGGADISGAIAQADVLGIFGQQGVYAAALWPLSSNLSYINAAFNAYRNYDGSGAHFGDTSVKAINSDTKDASVYVSTDTATPNRMVVLAINKLASSVTENLTITNFGHYQTAKTYRLTSASSNLTLVNSVSRTPRTGTSPDTFQASLPPMSVSVFELTRGN